MNCIFLIENRILQFLTWSHVLCATEKKYYVSAIIFFENIKCYFKLDWKLLTEQEYLVRCTHSEFSKFRMPLTDRELGQLPYVYMHNWIYEFSVNKILTSQISLQDSSCSAIESMITFMMTKVIWIKIGEICFNCSDQRRITIALFIQTISESTWSAIS